MNAGEINAVRSTSYPPEIKTRAIERLKKNKDKVADDALIHAAEDFGTVLKRKMNDSK